MMEHLSNNSLPQQLANIIDGPSTSAQAAAALAAASAAAAAATSNTPPANSFNGGNGGGIINGENSISEGNSTNFSGGNIIMNGRNSMMNGGNNISNGGNGMILNGGSNSYHMNGVNHHFNGGNIMTMNGGIHTGISSSINYSLTGISMNGGNNFHMSGGNNLHMSGGNNFKNIGGYNNNNNSNMNGSNRFKINGYHNTNGVNRTNMNGGNIYNSMNTNGGGNSMNMNGGNSMNMNGGNSLNINGGNSYNGGNSIIMNGVNSSIPMNNGYSYAAHNITSTPVYNNFNSVSNTRHINFSNVGLIGELAELTNCAGIPVPDIGLTVISASDTTTASGSTNYSGTSSSTTSHSSERCLPNSNNSGAYPDGPYQAWDSNTTNLLLPTTLRNIASPPPPPPRTDFFMANFLAAVEQQNQQQQKLTKQQQQQHNLQQRKQQQLHHNQVLFNQPPPPQAQHQQLMQANPQEEEEEGAVGGAPAAPVAVIAPIGTGPRNSARTSPEVFPNVSNMNINGNDNINHNYICEVHNELYRYVCDFCRKLVCQCCTLHEHKDHCYISISSFLSGSKEKLKDAINSTQTGTKCIKSSIDKALGFIRLLERNCTDLGDTIRRAYKNFIATVEERERFMIDFVDRLRLRRLALLHDQMAGLKSALAGLAETSEMLNQTADNYSTMGDIELALKLTSGQRQMEQFASIYKDLQPKHEILAFINPDYNALSDVRLHGGVCLLDDDNKPTQVLSSPSSVEVTLATMTIGTTPLTLLTPNGRVIVQEKRDQAHTFQHGPHNMIQMPPRSLSAGGMTGTKIEWDLTGIRSSPGLYLNVPRCTQAVPGCTTLVYARQSNQATISFAGEGHEDGQVSRPWGICVDKFSNILVSDRRNNRVQVFSMDGQLKFKFGRKGVNNGEFDLPAGICVDIDNRIIVVDKDNHRVQIFSSTGVYLNKFGSYGKEYGQFQYPWDVAVNTRRQIVVTDSRNHRIQQFDSEGRFIRQIVFDNHGQTKGIASPRGVCYAPTGNIIVSDFDNHCLYLIDPDAAEVISTKGHEGNSFHEFNRPSGLCCDDEGRIIVADSKNQRVLVFNANLDFLWDIEVRPSVNPKMPPSLDEKDRTCDVAVMPDGRIVFLIELSPDSKEGSNPFKRFVHIC